MNLDGLPRETTDLVPAILAWGSARSAIKCVWLFGSRVRDDFRPDSDIDIAVGIAAPETYNYNAWFWPSRDWRKELAAIIPYEVDL